MRVLYEPEDVKFWTSLLLEAANHKNQRGGGLSGFQGVRYQRGAGLGSFFRGVFRAALPVISSIGKTVGKQALSSGVAMTRDVGNGESVGQSFINRNREAAEELLTKAANAVKQTGNGKFIKRKRSIRKRKAKAHKRPKVPSKKHKKPSIFDSFA